MSHNKRNYRDYIGSREDKHYKADLFKGDHLFAGINCLNPGQVQPPHEHNNSDKFYIVMEGTGRFTVGEETFDAGPGELVWSAAGVAHGVENTGDEMLVLIVGIAPIGF